MKWSASDNDSSSYFSARTFGLGERGAHRQPGPQAGSTVLLQIQTGSFGEPAEFNASFSSAVALRLHRDGPGPGLDFSTRCVVIPDVLALKMS